MVLAPPTFRRRAIAHMPYYSAENDSSPIIFPHRIHTRLRVSLTLGQPKTGSSTTSHSAMDSTEIVEDDLNVVVKSAQREIIDQEIFEVLIKEAGDLPTASARVSERLIVVDAVPGVELRFEMVSNMMMFSVSCVNSYHRCVDRR